MRTEATLKMDCRGGFVLASGLKKILSAYSLQMYFADFEDSVIVELISCRGNFVPQ